MPGGPRRRAAARMVAVCAATLAMLAGSAAAISPGDPRLALRATGGERPVRGVPVSFCLDEVTPRTGATCADGIVRLAKHPAAVARGARLTLVFGAAPSDVSATFQHDVQPKGADVKLHPRKTVDALRFSVAVPRNLPCGLRVVTVFVYYGRVGHVTKGDALWALPLRSRRCATTR